MMFDWNEQDQVVGTIWGEFCENEDHIVPYPKAIEENASFAFEEYSKKQRKEAKAVLRCTDQTSGAEKGFTTNNLRDSSFFSTNEEISASRFNMETWTNFPALRTGFNNGYNDSNHQGALLIKLENDFSGAPNPNRERGNMSTNDHSTVVFQSKDTSAQRGARGKVQLHSEQEPFSNDKFLECDWASIGDFNDLDKIFRSDSFFGHDMSSGTQLVSSSANIIDSVDHTVPLHDIVFKRGQMSGQSCSSFQFVEQSDGRQLKMKTADSSLRSGDHIVCHTLTGEYHETDNHLIGKENEQRELLKPQRNTEEKNKSAHISNSCSHNTNHGQHSLGPKMCPVMLPAFQAPTRGLTRQIGDDDHTEQLSSYNQSVFTGLNFPASSFVSHNQAYRNQTKPFVASHKVLDSLSHSNYSDHPPYAHPRSTMTPQEKIEKLRRRQQMQAILAIKKQQEQLGHQITYADSLVFQVCPQKDPSQEANRNTINFDANKLTSPNPNLLLVHEKYQISPCTDDDSLEETIYYQLQEALGKLDTRARLFIRDSLFRLARSAMERQCTNDSSADKSDRDECTVPENEEINYQNRGVTDAEIGTNPADRTVVNLLFYRLPDSCARTVKEEIPEFPISYNPGQKVHSDTGGVLSEYCSKKF